MEEDIKGALRDFVLQETRVNSIGDDDNLFASRLVNSLFAIQLVTFIERRFGVRIEDDDLEIENFQSVHAMTALVERKRAR
jgi:methoxymalonate biosynthesis acyl carrier protein